MITPEDIRKKARNKAPAVLRESLAGGDSTLLPWKVPFRTPRERDMSWIEVDQWRRALEQSSKDQLGYGYTLIMERKRFHGTNEIPTAILFASAEDIYRFANWETPAAQAHSAFTQLTTTFPETHDWALRNLACLIDNASQWPHLIRCLLAYRANPQPNCYRREFTAAPHSKYLEEHAKVLTELLNLILPSEWVNAESEDFDRRFGFKKAPAMAWVRFLDPRYRPTGIPEDFIALPISSLSQLPLPDRVLLSENKIPLLSLPFYRDTIGFFSEGRAAARFAAFSELQSKKVYYWGDLDCHGLAILGQVRAFCPQVIPLAMDTKTYRLHERWAVTTTIANPDPPLNLTAEERELYDYLSAHNLRLEHERIPHQYVLETFLKMGFCPIETTLA